MDKNENFDEIEQVSSNENEVEDKKISKEGPNIEGHTVQKNIETIMELEKSAVQSRSAAELVADKVTTFAGSTPFIILHIIWFGGWILINGGVIPWINS